MKRKTQYDTHMKIRVMASEKAQIAENARAAQQSLSAFVRQCALGRRVRQDPFVRELVRHVARIGSNINQIARAANMHMLKSDAVDVILALGGIEAELQNIVSTAKQREASHSNKDF